MPNDQAKEVSQAGKVKEFVQKHGRKIALATSIGIGSITGAAVGSALTGEQPQRSGTEVATVKSVEMNLLDWHRMPLDEQRKEADTMLGKEVTLKVNTPDLRLHYVLISPDDSHAQLHLIMDPKKYPQDPGKNFDGHPVELRVTKEQYENLKAKFGTMKDPEAMSEGSYPGDIRVPEGTKLEAKVEKLPRGTESREAYSEFVLVNFIPPQTAASK